MVTVLRPDRKEVGANGAEAGLKRAIQGLKRGQTQQKDEEGLAKGGCSGRVIWIRIELLPQPDAMGVECSTNLP